MPPSVSCRDFVEFLDDYLEGALESGRRDAFEAHLAFCPSCVAYMKTYRATRALSRDALRERQELPPDVPRCLMDAILRARAPGDGSQAGRTA